VVGFLGAGNVLPAYLATLDRLVVAGHAGYGPVLTRSADRAAELRARRPGLPVTDELERLLDGGTDVVVVLTPPDLHPEHVRRCLAAGSHVLCEKPLAPDAATARELVDAAGRAGRHLASAPFTHLSPTLRELWTLVQDGAVGQVHSARAMYANLGGDWAAWFHDGSVTPLGELGIYSVRSLTSLLGPVGALVAVERTALPERVLSDGTTVRAAPDVIHVLLEHRAGAVSAVMASRTVHGYRRPAIELYGTAGTANLLGDDWDPAGLELLQEGTVGWRSIDTPDRTWSWTDGLRDLVLAVRTGRVPASHGDQDVHLVEIVEAASHSARTARRVELVTDHALPDLRVDLAAVARSSHDHTRAPEDQ
jgi:predicted dehydrogenase